MLLHIYWLLKLVLQYSLLTFILIGMSLARHIIIYLLSLRHIFQIIKYVFAINIYIIIKQDVGHNVKREMPVIK